MIKIDLLKNHPHSISTIANIWYEVLGKVWMPEMSIEEIKSLYNEELTQDIPLTYIALCNKIPIGSCTLELNGRVRPERSLWLGDLVVDPKYQRQGIGKKLTSAAMIKAKELGFEKLYCFTFEPSIVDYYQHLGWQKIGTDEFEAHHVTVMRIGL